MAHPHEDLVRRGYDAFAKGDTDTLRELFDPGIVWHLPGRSLIAGDHRGVDAVLGFFGRTMELTAGTFRADLHDVVADDQHTVVDAHVIPRGCAHVIPQGVALGWCSTWSAPWLSRRGGRVACWAGSWGRS